MNGYPEPLPGLLDDPQFQNLNLSTLPEVHLAPLRNPAPSKHAQAPLPLEPSTKSSEDGRHGTRGMAQNEEEPKRKSPPQLKPSDVLSAKEAKKPHLAISELLETNNDTDSQSLQLPSFVSLAVVEKSPVQAPSHLSPHKRIRLELDVELPSRDVGRRLPRPAQKDDKQARPVPLLPAMVTGLHEPPPSAGILPSMDLDARPKLTRPSKASKMQVKDILTEARQSSTHVPPEAMLNTPEMQSAELARLEPDASHQHDLPDQMRESSVTRVRKDPKSRRARRKWASEETASLMAGVKKHGFGKWKQILMDPAYAFYDRTSMDLKDRYRVVKDQPCLSTAAPLPNKTTQADPPSHETDINKSEGIVDAADTADAGKPKRKRRPWTPAEDADLMRGLSKHGFQWTAIHDDPELDLSHRRATDLRDRIRNLYPEGYKQAEVRPLKSEMKKTEKSVPDGDNSSSETRSKPLSEEKRPAAGTASDATAVVTSGSLSKRVNSRNAGHKASGDAHQTAEQVGVTLPSLALDDDDDLDWGDNTLPPLLEWEDIGM